jgi:hypothetical protein
LYANCKLVEKNKLFMKKFLLFFAFFTFCFSFCNAQFTLWGMTPEGGQSGSYGVIFQFNPTSNSFVKKFDFIHSHYFFSNPKGNLLLATDGILYGMSQNNPLSGPPYLFKYDLNSDTCLSVSPIVNYTDIGQNPYGSLIQAGNGKLYGIAYGTLAPKFRVLIFGYHIPDDTIACMDELQYTSLDLTPKGDLLQVSSNILYGSTYTPYSTTINGTIFKYVISANTASVVYLFNNFSNGANPSGGLIQDYNGKLYGVTSLGGLYNSGVLFEYDTSGIYSKKKDFDSINTGAHPVGKLLQASNGKLYGLTYQGGIYNFGILYEYDISTNSLIKKIDFDSINNGSYPEGSLIQASDGKIYGMTNKGGIYDLGVIFQYDPDSNILVKKFDFDGTNGQYPTASLIEIPDSLLTTSGFEEDKKYFNIYPNPSHGEFNLESNSYNFIKELIIFDIQGRIMYSENNLKKTEHISVNIKPGIYFIQINSDNGCIQKKLIIE